MTITSTEPENHIALVTGATRGLGKEIAAQLSRLGMIVLVGARDPDQGAEVAHQLRDTGAQAHSVRVDVTEPDTLRDASEWIAARFGRLDVLVNNAGIVRRNETDAESFSPHDASAMFDTNVVGIVRCIQAFLPLLRRSPAGRIVNVSSTMGSLGTLSDPNARYRPAVPVNLGYIASKAAVNALTLGYAVSLAETTVKVNAGDPGRLATDFNDHQGERTPGQGAQIMVRLATLAPDGPTGGYFTDDGPLPW